MKDTLQIIGCSRTKVWDKGPDASFYVPAKHAYKGRGFLKALTQITGPWIILSGKYGYIEPDHPIGNYDVALGRVGSVSDSTLKAQVRQYRYWYTIDGLVQIRLADFKHVVCLNCDVLYARKVRRSFKNKIKE